MSISVISSPDILVAVTGESSIDVTVVHGPTGPQGPAGPTEVSEDAGNEASLGTDGRLFVGAMRMRSIAVYTTTTEIPVPTGDWRWLHVRGVAGGGGGGASSVNARGGQAGGGGGGFDIWIDRVNWDIQLTALIDSLLPAVVDDVTLNVTVGGGGASGFFGGSGANGQNSAVEIISYALGIDIDSTTLAFAEGGGGGRGANASISGFGGGGTASFNADWATGITAKGDGGNGRATLNAETGFAGGRSMLGGGGDAGPADGVGGNATGYGGGGGSGARSASGSNGNGGFGAPGVIILEVYD